MAAQGSPQGSRADRIAFSELLRYELDSTREALLKQEAEHHAAVMARLDGIQTTLNALTSGQIQLGIQGMAFFGGNPIDTAMNPPARHEPIHPQAQAAPPASLYAPITTPAPTPALAPQARPVATPARIPREPRSSAVPPVGAPGGPPDYQLVRLRTVGDAWQEWKSGINGGPPVEELERVWGGAWRPSGKARVAFCRRKVIWDEVARLMRTGLSAEEAVQSLELLRDGGSLVDLGRAVKSRQRARGRGLDVP